jgi:hypothetical protein
MPNVDVIGINSAGGASWFPNKVRTSAKPFILTEFGPLTSTGSIADEATSTEKARQYRLVYDVIVESWDAEATKGCLGSYAFLWGWKCEQTLT